MLTLVAVVLFAGEPTSLFDGETLSGWEWVRQYPIDKNRFRVEEGSIVVEGMLGGPDRIEAKRFGEICHGQLMTIDLTIGQTRQVLEECTHPYMHLGVSSAVGRGSNKKIHALSEALSTVHFQEGDEDALTRLLAISSIS